MRSKHRQSTDPQHRLKPTKINYHPGSMGLDLRFPLDDSQTSNEHIEDISKGVLRLTIKWRKRKEEIFGQRLSKPKQIKHQTKPPLNRIID
jgi:hypothetical protein